MTPTAWDLRNNLLAILSAGTHGGKPYVDVESGNLFEQSGGDPNSTARITLCNEIMTRMMRPGDLILKDCPNENAAPILIRYILKTKHEN
jgi:hypothetical protein